MSEDEVTDVATRYAAAWSSQAPAKLASFYSEDGSLKINDGTPSVGRAAITKAAASFMTGYPDMVVSLDKVIPSPSGAEFHWCFTGTNTGPGGTGRSVLISGYEDWIFNSDGLIQESKGHYDAADWDRQVNDQR